MRRSDLALGGVLALVTVLACGEVTGLTDDYQFDLVDASAADAGGDVVEAASVIDARQSCSVAERAQATQTINQANGDKVSPACRQCLASECCREVAACSANKQCEDAMRCVFDCESRNGGDRQECLADCNQAAIAATVGTCATEVCPACSLR